MAVSIVQIPVWCLNIHRTPVRYTMLRHTLGASGARRESISQQAFNFIHAAMEAFITLSTLRSRLYYVTLDWPA